MLIWKILLLLLIIFIGCAGKVQYDSKHKDPYNREYYESRGIKNLCAENPNNCGSQGTYYLPPPPTSYNSGYQPDVNTDNSQGYQIPTYKDQQHPYNQTENQWKYIPPQPEQEPGPDFFINTRTGDSYMRLGNDENSWYVGPKGDTIMPFGDWKIDQKGNTYLPFGDGYIDSKGTYFMPSD